MKLLSIDSSAKSASVCVLDGEKILAESFLNTGLTHSETLMPMVDGVLSSSKLNIADIDVFAVNVGPGSFTGIRIGVAAVKGLAFPSSKKCAPVSTLESIAYNFIDEDCIICSAMDARRNQAYTAVFESRDGKISRLTPDRAISAEEMALDLKKYSGKIYLAGDGASVFYDYVNDTVEAILPSELRLYQRASGVGLAAIRNADFISPENIVPCYLRPSQAERELKGEE